MNNNRLPYSAAADRNKQAIGDALASFLGSASTVLEIGSGSGQHAIHLCEQYRHLLWQPTEQFQHLEALTIALSPVANIQAPVELEVVKAVHSNQLPLSHYSFAFSANTAHIMSMEEVAAMFQIVKRKLEPNAVFALYGPFNIDGRYTSEGNQQFDASLRMQSAHMGIRDVAELEAVAHGFELIQNVPMPSNNSFLIWRTLV